MKKIILPILVTTLVLGSGLFVTKYALAEGDGQGHMSALVQKIADKFGLNVDDVQEVFNQDRQERQEEMRAKFEERLSDDVAGEVITEDQKQLILQKREELEAARQANMESMQDLSEEERRTAMETEREELKTWAEENGIDLKYIMGGFGMRGGGHGGLGGPGGPGPNGDCEPPSDSVQS